MNLIQKCLTYVPVRIAEAFQGTINIPQGFAGELPGIQWAADKKPKLVRRNPTFTFTRDVFNTLSYMWNREQSREDYMPRRGVWIGGPKGAGKTSVLEQFFCRLGVPLAVITCNRRIPLSDYITKVVPDTINGGWMTVPGPLKEAMEQGYPVILNEPSAMDEADLIAMHDIIDRGYHTCDDGTVIEAAKGFIVCAADNTMGYGDDGGHAGTNVLNSATMRRFIKLEIDYPEENVEVEILQKLFADQEEETLRAFVRFANTFRQPHRDRQSVVTMGTGELIDWVEATSYFRNCSGTNPAWFAFRRTMDGIPAETMEAARQTFQATFGVDVSGM